MYILNEQNANQNNVRNQEMQHYFLSTDNTKFEFNQHF